MTKFLVIFLVIVVGVFLVFQYIKRKIIKMFNIPMNPQDGMHKNSEHGTQQDEAQEDVIYDKDDVVVMKGDAKETEDENQ
jgi:hypothetical protein